MIYSGYLRLGDTIDSEWDIGINEYKWYLLILYLIILNTINDKDPRTSFIMRTMRGPNFLRITYKYEYLNTLSLLMAFIYLRTLLLRWEEPIWDAYVFVHIGARNLCKWDAANKLPLHSRSLSHEWQVDDGMYWWLESFDSII